MFARTPVAIHVAIAENGTIGRENGLPWKLSSDLKRFKSDTMGKPVIMGRKTWQSIGRPLPGRLNIVVTRDKGLQADGALVAGSLEDALRLADERRGETAQEGEICIIGGGEIYAQALPLADRLHITHVLAQVDGDTHFPAIDPEKWQIVESHDLPAGDRDSHATRHTVYERRQSVQ